MGVVANMAPDLFLGIIADVPFVDVLNTMLDKDLPLTPPEWPEWGNPIESARDFEMKFSARATKECSRLPDSATRFKCPGITVAPIGAGQRLIQPAAACS